MTAPMHQENDQTTVVMHRTSDYQPPRSWRNLLHTHTAFILRMGLLFKPGIVISMCLIW